jgi:hypothetical protein
MSSSNNPSENESEVLDALTTPFWRHLLGHRRATLLLLLCTSGVSLAAAVPNILGWLLAAVFWLWAVYLYLNK